MRHNPPEVSKGPAGPACGVGQAAGQGRLADVAVLRRSSWPILSIAIVSAEMNVSCMLDQPDHLFLVQVNTIPAIFLTKNRFKREGMGVRRNERDSRATVPLGAPSLKNTWRKRPRSRHTRDTQSTDQAKHKIVLTIPNVIFLR